MAAAVRVACDCKYYYRLMGEWGSYENETLCNFISNTFFRLC